MNSDIRLAISWFNHPKRVKLERRIGAKGALSFIDLLLSTAQSKPDGVLSGWDRDAIAIAANWPGESDPFIAALVDIRLLDFDGETYSIHQWVDHNPYAAHASWRKERARSGAKARWSKTQPTETNNKECYKHKEAMLQAQTSYAPSPAPSPTPAPTPSPTPAPISKNKDNGGEPKEKTDSPPQHPLAQPSPIIVSIPLIKSHGQFDVTQKDIDEWQDTFPGINVEQVVRQIRQWNKDNPERRKTKRGIRQHIGGWLAREQNRARDKPTKTRSTEELAEYLDDKYGETIQ